MPDLQMVRCPSCDGRKGGIVHQDGYDPKARRRFSQNVWQDCRACAGVGSVHPAIADFLNEADRRCKARREAGVMLSVAAAELGITTRELNSRYMGRQPFPDQTELHPEVLSYLERRNSPGGSA